MNRRALTVSLLTATLAACQSPSKDGAPELDLDALQQALPPSGASGALFTYPGTKVGYEADTLLDENFIQLLEVATTSVDVAMVRLEHPAMSEAILEAWDRGLDVRVVGDADNTKYPGFGLLTDAGVPLVTRPAGDAVMNNRYVIVDEQVVWTGSTELTTEALTYNNNDALYVSDETVAAVYTDDFEEMFNFGRFGAAKRLASDVAYDLSIKGSRARVGFGSAQDGFDVLIDIIDSAEGRIVFAASALSHPDVAMALADAVGRGVAVVGIVDSVAAGDQLSLDELAIDLGVTLLIDGNRTEPAPGVGSFLQHNFLLADGIGGAAGSVLFTGSAAWTEGAVDENDENFIALYDSPLLSVYDANLCDMIFDGQPHVAAGPEMSPAVAHERVCTWGQPMVRINEIMANPNGADLGREYVEIVNMGVVTVDLAGWTLGDAGSARRHVFGSQGLAPGQAVVVYDRGSHASVPGAINASSRSLSLNNNGDRVILADSMGVAQDTVTYGRTYAGVSFNRSPDGDPQAPWALHDVVDGSSGKSSPGRRANGDAW